MKDEDILKSVEERIKYMEDNIDDLTVSEKIMQIQMVGTDMNNMVDTGMKRIVLALLIRFALKDSEAFIECTIKYPKEGEQNDEG